MECSVIVIRHLLDSIAYYLASADGEFNHESIQAD